MKGRSRNVLRKRTEDEFAFSDADMRHGETAIVNLFTAIEQYVEINVSRTFIDNFDPAHVLFNALQYVEEGHRIERGANLNQSDE